MNHSQKYLDVTRGLDALFGLRLLLPFSRRVARLGDSKAGLGQANEVCATLSHGG